MNGFVYFIRCRDFVKVGFAANPVARLCELQLGSPFNLEMLHAFSGSLLDERNLHRALSHYHHAREWYRWGDAISDCIESFRQPSFWDHFSDSEIVGAERAIGISRRRLCPSLWGDRAGTHSGYKLGLWLRRNKTRKYAFAQRIGVQPSVVTDYCKGRYCPSPKIAAAIVRETRGEITPNDFLIVSEVAA